jgi:YVTN family beta-propeller protein
MTLDTRARAAAQALRRSATRVDPVAGLEELLHRRRRRRITRAATALATATALALVAWVGVRGPERDALVTKPPPGSLGRVVATIPVGTNPVDVLVSEGAVWVANAAQGTVSRIDPATNAVTRTIRVGRNPVRLAAGFGSIWVGNETEQTISRIDANTGQPLATIPLPNLYPSVLAVGADSVWVNDSGVLVRIDPATNQPVVISADWELSEGEGGLAVAGGRVWLSGGAYSGVQPIVRVDPATNRKADTVPTAADGALAVGGGSVWQAGTVTQTIYRLDPKSGRTLAEIPIGVAAKHLTAADGSLWVGSDSGRVTRIDLATNKVTGTFQVAGRAPAVAVGHGSVWIVDTAHAALLRVQPTG